MEKQSFARILIFSGIAAAIGPGLILPCNFDMVWRLAGVLTMSVGTFTLLTSLKNLSTPEEEEEL